VGVAVAGIVALADVRSAIGFISFAVLVYYAVANAAAWTLGAEDRRWPRELAVGGLLGCAVPALSLPAESVIAGSLVFAAGTATYTVRTWRRSRV